MSKLLLYCTKAKPYLSFYRGCCRDEYVLDNEDRGGILNGKIVAECDFEVEEIKKKCVDVFKYCYITDTLNEYDLFYETQLDGNSMNNYLNGKGYAIHIKNLHIFDKPKELSDYYTRITDKDRMNDFKGIDVIFPSVMINELLFETVSCKKLEKAPQNMQKIVFLNKEINEYEYNILISIQPQWMCKILNGEKTIEVRKKVLKEMLNHE